MDVDVDVDVHVGLCVDVDVGVGVGMHVHACCVLVGVPLQVSGEYAPRIAPSLTDTARDASRMLHSQ